MYNKAKGAEAERKKKDQILGKMDEELTYLKRQNAKRIKVRDVVRLALNRSCQVLKSWYKMVTPRS